MLYDTVILTKAMKKEPGCNQEPKIGGTTLYFNLLDDYKSLLDRMKSKSKEEKNLYPNDKIEPTDNDSVKDKLFDHKEGILLEILKEGEVLTLQALCATDRVEQIHSKRIILESYDTDTCHKNVSMYELLWSAGVDIDSNTLKPILTQNYETSIQGLYYYAQP